MRARRGIGRLALPTLAALLIVAGCASKHSAPVTAKRDAKPSTNVHAYLRDSAGAGPEHWRSPDIKVDAPPYGKAPTTAAEFADLRDEGSVAGAAQIVYVEVWNRQVDAIEDPSLTLYAGPATTTLPRLSGPGSGWRAIDTVVLDRIEAQRARIARFELPPIPFGHQCIVVVLKVPGIEAPSLDTPADLLVAANGNVTARNMDIVDGKLNRTLVVRNPTDSPAKAVLDVSAPPGVEASLRGLDQSSVELRPGEQREVRLTAFPASGVADVEVTVTERLETSDGRTLEGGITYLMRPA
ncbi:MAG: hypothetical protein M3R70_09000 [Actinomycetota bacterium]|nr:hypothetical protein [Actinomycetota bacterium]